jgi:hypothetical protein
MVSGQPAPKVPPAFGGGVPAAAQFVGLTDDQVLKVAVASFGTLQQLPIGAPRVREWARFDAAMAELAARGMRHVLAKLHERDEGGRGGEDAPA